MRPNAYEDVSLAALAILGGLAAYVVVALIMCYPVMLLWNNCLVPAVNGINSITWLQAVGITFLSSLLFKSGQTSRTK